MGKNKKKIKGGSDRGEAETRGACKSLRKIQKLRILRVRILIRRMQEDHPLESKMNPFDPEKLFLNSSARASASRTLKQISVFRKLFLSDREIGWE